MDESPRQLIGEKRIPLPAEPGKLERYDTERRRNGTCDSFMFVAPLEGWRRAAVTERRTRADWAEQLRRLADEDFPQAEKIVLAMDNLNPHTAASLYERFPAEEAKRIRDKLEARYTPKHGSWLNMAERFEPTGAVATDTHNRTAAEGSGGMEPEAEPGSV
jgi:hypothetical protein